MIYVIVIESVLILGLVIYLIRLKMALSNITSQIEELSSQNTNNVVRNPSGQKMLNPLINATNKEIRALRDRTVRIERTNQEIRESLTEISHDLRTPLTAASGYTGMLKNMDLTEEEKAKYLGVIEERFETSRNLVDQLFYYTRLEADSLGWNEEVLDIRKILTSVLAMYYTDFEKKGYEPEVVVEEIKMPVLGDEDAVTRIFSNIISNGLSHGEGDFRIALNQDGDRFVFTFSNTATNINEEDAQHIFERYYSKDKVRSTSNTGLGLAIAKSLTEKMGGTAAASYSDNHLTIRITFPKSNKV